VPARVVYKKEGCVMKMKKGVVMLLGVCGLSWISMAAVAAEVTSADASEHTIITSEDCDFLGYETLDAAACEKYAKNSGHEWKYAHSFRNDRDGSPAGCFLWDFHDQNKQDQVYFNTNNSNIKCGTDDGSGLSYCVCGAKSKGMSPEKQATCLAQEQDLNVNSNSDFSQKNIKFCSSKNCGGNQDPKSGEPCDFYDKEGVKEEQGQYILYRGSVWKCGTVAYGECAANTDASAPFFDKFIVAIMASGCMDPRSIPIFVENKVHFESWLQILSESNRPLFNELMEQAINSCEKTGGYIGPDLIDPHIFDEFMNVMMASGCMDPRSFPNFYEKWLQILSEPNNRPLFELLQTLSEPNNRPLFEELIRTLAKHRC
jgi:hypothetical protein